MLENHSKSFIEKKMGFGENSNDTFWVIFKPNIYFCFTFGEALLTLDFVAFFPNFSFFCF